MSWTLASKVIHPESGEFGGSIEANFAINDVLDATTSTVDYYGSKSEVIQMQFTLFESENSDSGLSGLKTIVKAGTSAALVGDTGALGSWKIMRFEYRRIQALNESSPVYDCTVEMIEP